MFLKQLMQAPQPGSRGAQFGSAMGEMAPLLFSMAQGLRSGQGASAYAPQGLAAMMYQQQLADEKADKQRKEREAKASQAAAERMVAESLGMFGGGGGYGSHPGAVSQYDAMAAGGGPSLDAAEMVTGSPEWLKYANSGATRNRPLHPKLVDSLGFLPEMGIGVEVFSGGQPAEGQNRVGSRRHDHGLAADVFFTKDGRRLDWRNEADIPVLQSIVQRAKANGVTGFGAGEGYMQPGSMHIGFGTPAVWGAGGKGANAPEWLRAAYDGSAGTMSAKGTPASAPTQQRRISPERAGQILMNPNVPDAIKAKVVAQFMPQEQKDRDMKQDANGRWRYTDTGELVFPGVNVADKDPDQRTQKIQDAQRLYGMDEATSTALVDGIIKVVPDQLGGFNVVDMRRELRPEEAATPQPEQASPPPLSFNLPGVNDSFGIEGFGKGLANTVFDVAGAQVPYRDVQDAQSDFGVLREDILSDLANGYRRQPPSWVLQALDELTPKAGSPVEGVQKAQSKLRALDRKFEREIGLAEQQLRRRMKPTDRADIEGQLTSLRAARSRVQGMLGAFGGSSAGGIPQLFIDSVGDLPEGLTPDDVWAEMSEDEKAAFQQ